MSWVSFHAGEADLEQKSLSSHLQRAREPNLQNVCCSSGASASECGLTAELHREAQGTLLLDPENSWRCSSQGLPILSMGNDYQLQIISNSNAPQHAPFWVSAIFAFMQDYLENVKLYDKPVTGTESVNGSSGWVSVSILVSWCQVVAIVRSRSLELEWRYTVMSKVTSGHEVAWW